MYFCLTSGMDEWIDSCVGGCGWIDGCMGGWVDEEIKNRCSWVEYIYRERNPKWFPNMK